MSNQKPSIPQGTRDFGTIEVKKRQYIVNIIKTVFEKYGYAPIETPTMENLKTLTGKYGEEGDRLLFKVLNSGNYLKETPPDLLQTANYLKLLPHIAEKGLRYDLTIPFARYVVMHQHEVALPFRRYQVQPVWRADRPQRGRYREFVQCDADVIGSNALINDAELILMYDEAYYLLKLPVTIHINNRKILAGIADVCQLAHKLTTVTVAIDKLDKIGIEGVEQELTEKNIPPEAIQKLSLFLTANFNNNLNTLDFLKEQLQTSLIGMLGIAEIETVFSYFEELKIYNQLLINPTLARGLDYYTGCIFEVKTTAVKMGSLGGGGRYDDLTGVFGLKNMSGVGISFGLDRIYDVINELNLFPNNLTSTTKILFINYGGDLQNYAFKLVQQLRAEGICVELFPDPVKTDKQMKYANAKNIPFVVFCRPDDVEHKPLVLKNMETGEQQHCDIKVIIELCQ